MTESSARDAAGACRRVGAPVADVRAEPRDDAERVNQALLGTPVEALEAGPEGWARVRLPDYTGWMRERDLDPGGPGGRPPARCAWPRSAPTCGSWAPTARRAAKRRRPMRAPTCRWPPARPPRAWRAWSS